MHVCIISVHLVFYERESVLERALYKRRI